ncbi:MAG: hypothetical protein WBW99_05360 [Pseudolabrys sp.]
MQAKRLNAVAFARAVREEFDPADYSVAVKLRANLPKPWRWEIYCAGHSGAVERSAVFFESVTEATKEGKKALAHLLAKQVA